MSIFDINWPTTPQRWWQAAFLSNLLFEFAIFGLYLGVLLTDTSTSKDIDQGFLIFVSTIFVSAFLGCVVVTILVGIGERLLDKVLPKDDK